MRSNNAWFLDDHRFVFNNPLVQRGDLSAIRTFFTEVLHPSTVPGYYKPLTMTSLALDWRLGGHKGDLRAFNTTNLVLHTASTGLLFLWLFMLFRHPLPALLAALLFGLHPIHVESVAWLAQRKSTLSLLFALTALIAFTAYARRPKRRTYVLCAVAFTLGCLAKPTIVTLPLLMLVLDYWPLRRRVRTVILEKLPLLAIALLFGIITLMSQARAGNVISPGEHHNLLTILAVIPYDLEFYAAKILVPLGLVPFYAFPEPFALNNPQVLVGIIGGIVLVAAFALSARWGRAAAAGGLFFLLAWLPASGIIRFTHVIAADRFVYFPFIGLLLPITALLVWLLRSSQPTQVNARTILAALFTVAALCGLTIQTRNQIARWHDTGTLLTYVASSLPSSSQPDTTTAPSTNRGYAAIWAALGQHATDEGRNRDAVNYYAKTVACAPGSASAAGNLDSLIETLFSAKSPPLALSPRPFSLAI